MPKEYITIRLESEDIKTISQLIEAGVTESRSKFIRESVKSRLSEYTGEPNLHDIQKKVRGLESRLNILEEAIHGQEDNPQSIESTSSKDVEE